MGCCRAMPIENGGDNERELWPAGFKVHHSYLLILRFWSIAVEWMTKILADKFSVSLPKGSPGNLSRHLLAFNGRMPCARAPKDVFTRIPAGLHCMLLLYLALSQWMADDISLLSACRWVIIMPQVSRWQNLGCGCPFSALVSSSSSSLPFTFWKEKKAENSLFLGEKDTFFPFNTVLDLIWNKSTGLWCLMLEEHMRKKVWCPSKRCYINPSCLHSKDGVCLLRSVLQ